MKNKHHIIYNPNANRGGAKPYLEALCILLNKSDIPYTVYKTRYPHHATQITKDIIAKGSKSIIIVGGDGTIHEVINGYRDGDNVTFGIIPAGTGNDVATMLKIPHKLEDIALAAKNILNQNTKKIDFISHSNGMRSILFFSYGIAAAMILDMQKYKNKNKLSYYKALFKNVFSFKPGIYEVDIEGKKTTYKADFCSVHNCIHAGGGMELIKNAIIDDGQLELFIAENKGHIRRVLNFIAIIRKRVHLQPNMHIIPVKNITIRAIKNNLCCIDGELKNLDSLELSIKHKAISLYA